MPTVCPDPFPRPQPDVPPSPSTDPRPDVPPSPSTDPRPDVPPPMARVFMVAACRASGVPYVDTEWADMNPIDREGILAGLRAVLESVCEPTLYGLGPGSSPLWAGYETAAREIEEGSANYNIALQRGLYPNDEKARVAWDRGYHAAVINYRLGDQPVETLRVYGPRTTTVFTPATIIEDVMNGTHVVRPDPRKRAAVAHKPTPLPCGLGGECVWVTDAVGDTFCERCVMSWEDRFGTVSDIIDDPVVRAQLVAKTLQSKGLRCVAHDTHVEVKQFGIVYDVCSGQRPKTTPWQIAVEIRELEIKRAMGTDTP